MVLSNHKTIPVDIPEEPLLRRLGKSRKEQKISQRLKKKIKKAAQEIDHYAQPKAVFNVVSTKRNNGFIVLDNKVSLRSKKLASTLNPCRRAAIFLTTIGSEVDRIIKQNMKSRPHYGFLLDAAASVAAESTAQYIQDYLEASLGEDENTTLRYSPGYCDWPLEEQEKIFRIIPHKTIGVDLSENHFMLPSKSISGVIGICPSDRSESSGNTCLSCSKRDCPHRRSPTVKIDVH
jgi:hypothetical protein